MTTQLHSEVVADARWLHEHLSDPDVRVIEVDVSARIYDEGHIDGAVLWNIYQDLKDANYQLVDTFALERIFTRSGISPSTTVVFYGYAPALGYWLLKACGHEHARILGCTRDAWRAQGHPWTTALPELDETGFPVGGVDRRLRADRTAVERAVGRPDTVIIDVRTDAEYRGQRFWPSGGMEPNGRAGHIPTAVHQPIDDLYNEDGTFRSPAELRAVFSHLSLDGNDELITYCTIGGRAATAWFVLTQLLGRDHVRVYDGSWADWGRTPDSRIETA